MNFEEYGVMQGLKHMRYDYEDSAEFMKRVLPDLIKMRTNAANELYKWQEPDRTYTGVLAIR